MAHFEDCKFFLRGACVNGPQCGFRHNEASCRTERLCNRWAAGYTCDGRCNLRHPSAAEIAALAAAPPPAAAVAVRAAPLRQQRALATPRSKFTPQPEPQQKPAVVAVAPLTSAAPPCRFHARGLCAKGDACPFFHAPSSAAQASTLTPSSVETRTIRSRPTPTTLRGAAAAARKKQQQQDPFDDSGGEIRTQYKGGDAGVGWVSGGVRAGRVAAGNSGGGGVSQETDAAAKARAADILQKHRLTSSAPAVEAGSRGGMRVRRGPPTQPGGKKACTASPAQRQPLPSAAATHGQAFPASRVTDTETETVLSAAAGAEEEAAAAAVVPAAPPLAVVVSTEPSPPDGSKCSAESGEKVDGGGGDGQENGARGLGEDSSNGATVVVVDVAGTEEAPSCDRAVVHARSQQQQQQQQEKHRRTAHVTAEVS